MIYRRLLSPVLAKAPLLSLLGVAFSNGAFAGAEIFKHIDSWKASGEILDRQGVRFVGNGAISLCERNR